MDHIKLNVINYPRLSFFPLDKGNCRVFCLFLFLQSLTLLLFKEVENQSDVFHVSSPAWTPTQSWRDITCTTRVRRPSQDSETFSRNKHKSLSMRS